MKLIVGLGNPGPRYADSRHNIGFMVVDALAATWKVAADVYERNYEALLGSAQRGGEKVLLLKPQTYMNLSGRSVAAAWRFYKLTLEDVLVIYDDMDLPVGKLRVRASGSAGGHNGMSDVIRHLSSDRIARIRVGIGRQGGADAADYVTSSFRPGEKETIRESVTAAAGAAECWLTRGVTAAMNEFNKQSDEKRGDGSRGDGSDGDASRGDASRGDSSSP
ncbi:Peptidyl-tRNA hydrolase [Phycisphaerae bacterium RAS1]|nr:Peptidyl-tRNA hydrolase [Phycisphaerae bacterium RAS1]